jgi:arylsulfatase A-like enzyme
VLDVTLRADRVVAELLRFLDDRLGRDRYTVVITADHGVCPIPEQGKIPTAGRVNVAEVFRTLGTALDETFGREGDRPGQWFEGAEKPDRVWPWLYLNRARLKVRGIPYDAVCDYVAQWLGNRPYLEAACTRAQIEAGKFPPGGVGEKLRLAYHPDRCGDVIGIPKPGVLVTVYEHGTSHGTPHPYDTHVPVLVCGAGVPALGKRSGRVSSLIVAPTLAWALGIDPPAAAGAKVPAELTQGR